MNKIIIKHSCIIINNYEWDDSLALQHSFSIYDKLYHTLFYKAIEYKEEEKQLILPRGIDIDFLEKIFNCKATIDYSHDPYDVISDINLKYMPRDNTQKRALAFIAGVKEYSYTASKSQLSINLPTGKGKTYCSITGSAYYGLRSIIITSSIQWLEQWRDCIVEYTDTKFNEIYMLVGSASINRLIKRGNISDYKFILASHDTLKSYGDRNGWDKITELFKYMKVGLKFYDEAHLNFDNMAKIDFYTNTYKTFYITATPARSDKDENFIYRLYFKNIPSIDLFCADTDPHTHYVGIKFNSHPKPTDLSACKNAYGFDKNKYCDYITKNNNFYIMLSYVLNIALSKEGKCVIYIATNDAIKRVKQWIEINYPLLINNIGVYTSIIDQEEKAKALDKKIILSTTKSLGAAVDIKGLKMVVVAAEPFKSEVLAKQSLGRTRDNDTYYIEFVDVAFTAIKKYYKTKQPIFLKYALSCKEIDFSIDRTFDILTGKVYEEKPVEQAILFKAIQFNKVV